MLIECKIFSWGLPESLFRRAMKLFSCYVTLGLQPFASTPRYRCGVSAAVWRRHVFGNCYGACFSNVRITNPLYLWFGMRFAKIPNSA